jgi:hypothetical protein
MRLHNDVARAGTLVLLLLTFASTALGQLDQRAFVGTSSMGLSTANYYYARPNDMTIIVSVMGAVARPGRYEISKSIDLLNLLALAGGPTAEGSSDKVKIARIVEIGGKATMREFEVDLSRITKLTPADLALEPGDIVVLDRSGWATARTVFEVFVGAAVIVTAVSQVIIATSYK